MAEHGEFMLHGTSASRLTTTPIPKDPCRGLVGLAQAVISCFGDGTYRWITFAFVQIQVLDIDLRGKIRIGIGKKRFGHDRQPSSHAGPNSDPDQPSESGIVQSNRRTQADRSIPS